MPLPKSDQGCLSFLLFQSIAKFSIPKSISLLNTKTCTMMMGWGQEDEEEFLKQAKRERGKEMGMSVPTVKTIIPSLQWLCWYRDALVAGGNPPLWQSDGMQRYLPSTVHGHHTRLPYILIFLSSHGDITAAPSERRLEAKPHSPARQMHAHSSAFGTSPCCSESFPFASSGVEKMKAKASEDLRQVWSIN